MCCLSPAELSQQPGLDGPRGTRCKVTSQGENPVQEIQQAILHCLRHQGLCHSQAEGQERHREAKGHSLHRHLHVSQTSSSALGTTAPRGFVKFKLVLQHEEKNCFVSASKEQISIAQHLVQFRGPNLWGCASVRSEAHGGTKFTPGLSEEEGKRTVGCDQG